VRHRAEIAEIYRSELAAARVRLPVVRADTTPSWVRYPVWVENREAVVRATAQHAVLGTWFTSVLEEAVAPEAGGYTRGSCPRAEEAGRHLVNLPTHPRVRPEDAEAIAAVVAAACA
jgi:dTDP-4-amino-4,6-dideoxygalactose transaminase